MLRLGNIYLLFYYFDFFKEYVYYVCLQDGDIFCRLVRNGVRDWNLRYGGFQNLKSGLEMIYDFQNGKKLFRFVGFVQKNYFLNKILFDIFWIKIIIKKEWIVFVEIGVFCLREFLVVFYFCIIQSVF